MFADDTNLSCQGKSSTEIENKINTDLENVHKWLIANKLTLNQEKNGMHVGRLKTETTTIFK
jgi:hypothetical protein